MKMQNSTAGVSPWERAECGGKTRAPGMCSHSYLCHWLIPDKIYPFAGHHLKTYTLVKGLLWLLLSQGSHFLFLYFNDLLYKLVFIQPLRCLDEKDLQQDRRSFSASWLWQKSGKWNANLLDPSFYRTMDAHAGTFVCLSLAHGCSLQPRPAQEELEDDPWGAWSWHN